MAMILLQRMLERGQLLIPPKTSAMPTAEERLARLRTHADRQDTRIAIASDVARGAPNAALELDWGRVGDVASVLRRMRWEACKVVAATKRKKRRTKGKTSAEPAAVAPPAATSTALVVADESDDDDVTDGVCQGAYVGCMAVITQLVKVPPSGTLSVRAHGCQYELVLRAMAADGAIGRKCSAAPAILRELQECAVEITRLVSQLLVGWKSGMAMQARGGRSARLEVVDDTAAFDDWWPYWVTYRALALENGKDVNSFLVEFLADMFEPGVGKHAHVLRQTAWTSEPYYVKQALPLMTEMDNRAKRSRTKIGQRPVGSRPEDARRARPSPGPLGYPAYVAALPHLEALCADSASDGERCAAREALRAAHPDRSLEDLVEQHRFETALKCACRRVTDAYVTFVDESNPIFGSPPDFDACNGLFALTALNMNLQPYAEQVNRKETWLLRLLHRFISLHVTDLKDHNYRDINEVKKIVCHKRHSTQTDGDTLIRERRGHMIATVEALVVKELFVYINIRWSAFLRSPNGVPSRFQPPEKAEPAQRRAFLQKACNVWKNDPDAFKDAAMARADDLRTKKAAVLLIEQRNTIHDQDRSSDLAVLVMCTIGVNATAAQHPALLDHDDLRVLITPEETGPLKTPSERLDYFRKPKACIGNVNKAIVEMQWLNVGARPNVQALRQKLVELKRKVDDAIQLFDDGVRQTYLLRKHYDVAYKALFEKQAALLQMEEDTLDEDEEDLLNAPQSIMCDRAYTEALHAMETAEGMRNYLRVLCVQTDGAWRWTPPSFASMDERHAHKARLDAWSRTLATYIALLGEVSALPCVAPLARRTTFFDFMRDAYADVEKASTLRTVPLDGEHVAVDFDLNLKKAGGDDKFRMVDHRLAMFLTQRDVTISRMLRGIRGAFCEGLRWANAYATESTESVLLGLPRLHLGVSAVLKLLTVAEAFGRVHYTSDDDAHAEFADRCGGAVSDVFSVFDGTLFDQQRDIRCASVEQLNYIARIDWRCICALAVVAREVLAYNDYTQFRAGDVLLDLRCPMNATVGTDADSGGFIRVPQKESPEAALARLTVAAPGESAEPIEEVMKRYPSQGTTFLFSDPEFNAPEKLQTLFVWNPLIAHRTTGFYTLPKQSLSPDEQSGLMRHCGADVVFPPFPEEPLNFVGVFWVVEKLGVAHRPPHADGADSPAFALPF